MSTTLKQIKHPGWMAAGLMISAFIGLFGETALNMALTNIMSDFSVTTGTVQWLTTGFLLVLGILVPVSALLLQWFTTKQLATSALLFSIIGTIICALAPNFTLLLLGRIAQAVGTGILIPLMMNVILVIFPIEKRGSIMGIMGLVITLAPAIGPTLAGVIVDALSWHYIFWISLFFYIILFAIWIPTVQNVSEITKPTLDIPSITLSTIGFGSLIYGLGTLASKPFSDLLVWLPIVVSVIALLLFGLRQLKMDAPMIDLRVFRFPNFALGTILLFIGFSVILSSAILLPLYLKGALLLSAVAAGLVMLPGNILNAILAPIVGRVFDKIGPKWLLIVGFAFVLIANIIFVLSLSADTPKLTIIIAFAFTNLGLALALMPAQTNGLNELPPQLYPHGAAAMNTLQQIAGAAGTALAITLMNAGIKRSTETSETMILANGTHFAFIFILIIAVIGFVLTLFVKRAKPSM
ncbi:MDR family MFS transporter [Kurthia massiliensis]|uniref:MDR family MFS transporter n=1 Tax=Kurthia massiliensis TaxID=1033739 RepID=UPI00028892EB|nr:MDR family MFS transporter [Kurthia massiliensis]